jgi:hypothetical protein
MNCVGGRRNKALSFTQYEAEVQHINMYVIFYVCALEAHYNGNNYLWVTPGFLPFPARGFQIIIITTTTVVAIVAAVMKCRELLLHFAWSSELNFVKNSLLFRTLLLHTIMDRFLGHLTTRRWEDSIKMDVQEVGCWLDNYDSG